MAGNPPIQTDEQESRTLAASFRFAFQGIAHVISSQRNMRIHLAITAAAILAGLLLRLQALEWVAIIILIGMVLSSEMLNTALETLVDLVSPQFHPLARIVKDVAAGMVLVLAIIAVISGLILYSNAFSRLIG